MATNPLESFLQSYQAGKETQAQNRLLDMRQQAFDAEQASAAQKQAGEDRDRQLATLQQTASLYPNAPDMLKPHLYGQIVDLAEGVGFAPKGQLPRQLTPDIEPKFQQFLQSFASMGQQDNTPSAIRELQLLQANPELADLDMRRRTAGFDRPQLIQTDQGYAWATPQGATPLNYGGQQDAAPGLDQSAIQRNLAMLGARPGVQMTSGLRTAERNAAVGGKPNSQHLRGTAGDYVVPQAQRSQFMADAQAQGLQAIDEGDHVHVQAPRGARVMPVQKAEKGSELEQRLALADQLGATPEEKRRMVIGGDTGRDAQRISAKDATTARQKITQIQAARNQLNAVKEQFAKNLRGSYSAGPLADYLPTSQGQAFDRAVRNLAPLVTAVTRVPGVGAMSDYESKLQEATLPSRGTYESVTEQQIADLERLLDTVEGGYRDLLGEGTQSPAAGASSNGWSIKVKP
jgi:hypothetical protein